MVSSMIFWILISTFFHVVLGGLMFTKFTVDWVSRIVSSVSFSSCIIAFVTHIVPILDSQALLFSLIAFGVFMLFGNREFILGYVSLECVFVLFSLFNVVVLEFILSLFGTTFGWQLMYFISVGAVLIIEFYSFTYLSSKIYHKLNLI